MENQLKLSLSVIQQDLLDQILVKNEDRRQSSPSQLNQLQVLSNLQKTNERKEEEYDEKDKKSRKQYVKWSEDEKKTYWLGLMTMVEQNPMIKHSWGNWKMDKCFKKMQKFFKGNKDNTQIKSFDQRMKNFYKKIRGIDLEQAICLALKKLSLNQTETKMMENFQLKSKHTTSSNEREKINKYLENLIKLIQTQKAEVHQIINTYLPLYATN